METNRRSIRIPKFDYSQPGMYFITITSNQKKSLFGTFNNGIVAYNRWGNIVVDELNRLPTRFSSIVLDERIVMPDHLHVLLMIRDSGTAISQQDNLSADARRAPTPEKCTEQFGQPTHGSIPTIIRSFKASVTNKIRQIEHEQVEIWQRNYYEHMVRDENDLYRIRNYIHDNPAALSFS